MKCLSFGKPFALLILILLVLGSATEAQKLVDVIYPGAKYTVLSGINNHGVSVGTAFFPNGSRLPFMLSNGKFTEISIPFGQNGSADGINDNGDVVGDYSDTSNTIRGFLLSAGIYTSITFPGAILTIPFGINNKGEIVGYYQLNDGVLSHGFRSIGGILTTLDCPCGKSTTFQGINNSGVIVGFFNDANYVTHGLKYTSGQFSTVDYPGAAGTYIFGINDAGTLVGAFLDPAAQLTKGFKDVNGQFSSVGVLPDPYPWLEFLAINNSDQMVGSSGNPAAPVFNPLGNGFFVSTGPYAYVPIFSAGSVEVFDTETDLPVTSIPVGAGPFFATVNPNGSRVYATNFGSGTVSVIDASLNAVVATVPVGALPGGIVATPDGSTIYVGVGGANHVSAISTATNAITATIPTGVSPGFVAVTPDGKFVYVTDGGSAAVSVISVATNTVVKTIPVGTAPQAVAVTPDGKFVYVACATSNFVSVIDTATNTVIHTIPINATPYGISITPDGLTAYVSEYNGATTAVINLTNNTAETNVATGMTPFGSAVTGNGAFVWQVNLNSSNVSIISTLSNTVVATIPLSGSAYNVAMGPAAPTSQTITQPLSPTAPNQFNFGPHTLTVQYPTGTGFSGVNMTVVAAQDGEVAFKQRVAATAFANATCIIYAGAGGNCVDYKITCSNAVGNAITCPSVSTPSISVKTSFDTQQQIINPGFLTTPIGTNNWSNVFDSFYLQRIDPTMKGRTKGFSEFVAVDLGIANSQGAGTLSLLAPLQQNEPRIFPAGAAIPVGFQLASLVQPGVLISDAVAGITVVMANDANGSSVSKVVLQQPNAFIFNGSGYLYSLNTVGYAAGVYNLTIYGNAFAAHQVQFTIPASTSGAHLLTTVKSLSLSSTSHQYVAVLNVANSGTGAANGVIVTGAHLNAAPTSTALPVSIGDINPGALSTVTLSFPTSAGTARSAGTLTIVESYAGGSGGGGSRVILP